jgi:hypothetical protein
MGFPAVPSNGTSHKRGSCRVPHRTAPNQDLLDAVRFALDRIGYVSSPSAPEQPCHGKVAGRILGLIE